LTGTGQILLPTLVKIFDPNQMNMNQTYTRSRFFWSVPPSEEGTMTEREMTIEEATERIREVARRYEATLTEEEREANWQRVKDRNPDIDRGAPRPGIAGGAEMGNEERTTDKSPEQREWKPTDQARHERALHEAQQRDKSQRDRDPRVVRPDRSRERRPL
jgi:hypothetical protein